MPASGPQTTDQNPEFTRLHITPLDPELFNVVIPASAAPNARNVSYHTIETFPEKRYGFVDLLTADAEKLKTKLNGAVLKGSKMRIEKARPEQTMDPAEVSSKKDKRKSKDKEGSKKRKRDDSVADGVELSDRKVKRGWTETTDDTIKRKKKDRSERGSKTKDKDKDEDRKSKEKKEKKRTKSKYTDGSECLLKTQIPQNKDLPDKDKAEKKRKKKGNEREVTVHEFEKTTRFPSFLKDTGSKVTRQEAEYVEGKGWVDEDGNVVEAVVEKKPKKVKKDKKPKRKAKTPTPEPESDSETSSSGTSSDDDSDVPVQPTKAVVTAPGVAAAHESDSGTSSEGSSDEEESTQPVQQKTPARKADNARPESSGSSRSLTIKIPPPDTPTNDKVHPLEALYKRQKPNGNETEPSTKEAEPFSFFGGGGDDEDEEESNDQDEAPVMPMTPFTKQDYEWRNVRSAAPTPDTAHPTRMRNFWASQNDQDEDMEDAEAAEEEEDDDEAQGPTGDNRATSDFQNWFWENRKELNQSWMKRRKTAAKEKRNRENKARASRAV